jgi:tRNA(adenine34) deaminase
MWAHFPTPWRATLELAWEAYCDDCLPIGAIVTDADGQIISRGRNRIYQNHPADWSKRGAELEHAETEALRRLDFGAIEPHQCILYTTTEPCPMCMGTFYMSGLRTLHYAAREPWAGSVNLLGATWYLSRKPIKVFGPPDPVLEMLVMALFIEKDYSQRVEHILAGAFYERWMQVVPKCLEAGRALYQKGILAGLQKRSASCEEMVTVACEVIAPYVSYQ